jgi:hypothetical protein
VYQRLVDLDFLNVALWANLGRAGGLLNDANTLGMGAAIWAPLAIVAGWASGRPIAGVVMYSVLAVGMWSTGSRTALMTLTTGSVAVGIGLLQRRGIWQPGLGRLVGLIAVALLVLAAAVLPREFESGNPLMRALDRVPRLESAEIRRFVVEDLWVRFGYGQAAVDIVTDYPVAGVGVGAFPLVAPDYIYRRTGRQVAQDNAQNWWRHQVAELGIVGSVPSLWASALVLLLLRGQSGTAPVGASAVLRGVVLGVGLASLFGVPTQHPATAVSFATTIFWLHQLTAEGVPETSRALAPFAWQFAFGVSAIVAIGLVASARDGLGPQARMERFGSVYARGFSHVEGMSDFGEFRWAAVSAVSALPRPRDWLQLTLWAPYNDVGERNIRAVVRVNGRELVSHRFTSSEGETYFLAMPRDARRVTLEIDVTGAVPRHRAIQTAMLWRDGLPRSVPPEKVVQ